ncbi:MAG: hypothetical protein NVSMB6_28310 [Burkholderiaceae bacterium]
MKTPNALHSETERAAKVIKRSFSPETLEIVANELGAPIAPNADIFRALIVAGKAADFDEAVRLVAAHLDNSTHEPIGPSTDLIDGKIERRETPRRL